MHGVAIREFFRSADGPPIIASHTCICIKGGLTTAKYPRYSWYNKLSNFAMSFSNASYFIVRLSIKTSLLKQKGTVRKVTQEIFNPAFVYHLEIQVEGWEKGKKFFGVFFTVREKKRGIIN